MKRQNRLLLILIFILGLTIVLTTQSEREKASRAKGPAPIKSKPLAEPKYPMQVMESFLFSDENALNGWEEKVFKGRVLYKIEKDSLMSYVGATSEAAASALYYKVKLDPQKAPVISWKWRVEKFPKKAKPENLESQEEHDFAGRVYVIFPTFFVLNSKVLEYIWSENLPVGATGTSPYSKNIRLTVLESGLASPGEWRTEERDIVADYVKAFGREPDRDVGAVSFMTNAEHTGSSAKAMYDDIKLGYKEK
jgi:hypothetical protein